MDTANVIFQAIIIMFKELQWERIYFTVKLLFIFLDIVLITAIILVFPQAMVFAPKYEPKGKPKKKSLSDIKESAKNEWQKIIMRIELNPPQSYTIGLVEADSFIDLVLKELGVKGETMADRLKILNANEIKSLDGVWTAHKKRNEIVHTPGIILEPNEVTRHISSYTNFLKEIGII